MSPVTQRDNCSSTKVVTVPRSRVVIFLEPFCLLARSHSSIPLNKKRKDTDTCMAQLLCWNFGQQQEEIEMQQYWINWKNLKTKWHLQALVPMRIKSSVKGKSKS